MSDPRLQLHQLTGRIAKNIDAPHVGTVQSAHPPIQYLKGSVTATGVTFSGNTGYFTVDIPDSFAGGAAVGSITMPSATMCIVGDTVLVARLGTQYWIDQVIGRDFTVYEVSASVGYQNSWVDTDPFSASGGLRFWQDNSGVGHLDGRAARATATTGVVFTLPVAFCPLLNSSFTVATGGAVESELTITGTVTGTNVGNVTIVTSVSAFNTGVTWLIGA